MKKMIVLALLLNVLVLAEAQNVTKKLIENPNISWVAESKAFISFENTKQRDSYKTEFVLENSEGNRSGVQVLKYAEEALCQREYFNYFLGAKINSGLEDGTLKAFNEKGQEITDYVVSDMITTIDTFVSFDPTTFEETVEIKEGRVLYDWYEVTMVYYYDTKSNKIETVLKSLAPIIRVKKKKNKYNRTVVKSYESFIIPMNQKGISQLNINKSEVIWSKLSSIDMLDFSKAKVLKGNTEETMKTVFHDNIVEGKYNGFQTREGCDTDVVDALWIKEYKEDVEIDTFISFDPVTKKETIEVALSDEDKYDEIHLLGAKHYWYWDADQEQLVCDLKSIRFYRESYDDVGDFLYSIMMYEVDFKK
jgi:hypothetical protein